MAPSPAVAWGRISDRADKVLVVANGPSAAAIPKGSIPAAIAAGVHVIAVNGAVEWIEAASSFFTLDASDRIRPYLAAQRSGVDYFAAVPLDYGMTSAKCRFHRMPPEDNVTWLKRLPRKGLSDNPAHIHSGNSAWGAVQRARLMGAKAIAIVGMDGTRTGYARGTLRPRRGFEHLNDLFTAVAAQLTGENILVLNGSSRSTVTCFPRCSPAGAIKWITSDDHRLAEPALRREADRARRQRRAAAKRLFRVA